MGLPRGRTFQLSRGRRIVNDILHLARGQHLVMVEREVCVPQVAAARESSEPKPGWYAVFLKSFALACMNMPELRRSLLTFPYLRLYQHACTVAGVTAERLIDGEPTVLTFHVREPERMPLTQIHDRFLRIRNDPVESIPEFRRWLLMMRLPRPLRRVVENAGLFWRGTWREKFGGTFAASSIVGSGARVNIPATPLTSVFTFGEVDRDGRVLLQLAWDHRVFDGMTGGRGLVETERMLCGPILAELLSLARPARLAV